MGLQDLMDSRPAEWKEQLDNRGDAIIPHPSFVRRRIKNIVQALKYPSADAVTLYMPGFKALN